MASDPNKRHTRLSLNKLRERGLYLHSGSGTEQRNDNSDCTAAGQNAGKWQAREMASSLGSDAIDPKTGMVRLTLVEAVNSEVRVHECIMTKEGSPWRSYERIHQLRLGVGDRIHVAERKSPPFDIVTVRSWPGPHIEDKLHMLQQIQHPNFVSAFDAFDLEQSLCIVFEHMPISLQYVADNPYINELRLASVLGQMFEGLAYLETKGLEHGSLTCSNVLISTAHSNDDVLIRVSSYLKNLFLAGR